MVDEDLEIKNHVMKRNKESKNKERFSSISKIDIQQLIDKKTKLKEDCTSLKNYIRSLKSKFDMEVYMKKMESIERRMKSVVTAFEKWLVKVN